MTAFNPGLQLDPESGRASAPGWNRRRGSSASVCGEDTAFIDVTPFPILQILGDILRLTTGDVLETTSEVFKDTGSKDLITDPFRRISTLPGILSAIACEFKVPLQRYKTDRIFSIPLLFPPFRHRSWPRSPLSQAHAQKTPVRSSTQSRFNSSSTMSPSHG